ncbi:SNF1-interacting protein [Ascosphaera aggregata]|nr:SNF1-interacting protein [Ascosphaera aggregata]
MSILAQIAAVATYCVKIVSAHHILLLLLAGSALFNMIHTYQDSVHWWKERTAANFMNRVGIRPAGAVSKMVFVEDIDAAIAQTPFMEGTGAANSTCFATFHEANSPGSSDFVFNSVTGSDIKPRIESRRLQKTRQRLGAYRHDLLIALRVVNAIERESLQASWEIWLVQENEKCQMVKRLMDQHEQKPNDDEYNRLLERAKDKLTDGHGSISSWYKDYCISCQREHQKLVAQGSPLI